MIGTKTTSEELISAKNLKPLGTVTSGNGNNDEDKTEGVHYRNVFCSYFHGPLLVRNQHLADRMI